MADLIPPHGGVAQPIQRFVTELPKYSKTIEISNADLSSFYRIADGGLSPLTGPMTSREWNQVLEEEVIERQGKKYAWTIPIAFPIHANEASRCALGDTVGILNATGKPVGTLLIQEIYPFDKRKYLHSVYNTERLDHPGAHMTMGDERSFLVGGEIQALAPPKHPEYGDLVLSPLETRQLFAKRGWQKVVAFQTRNPLHRAHEYALVVGAEKLTREGFYTGAVLNPLVGETKGDDVDAPARMRTYRALIDNRALGEGDVDTELWARVDRRFTDDLILLGLDIKMFYAGPKEAIMHSIYRQNFGFTNIIIGRKHADAPYDDGKDIWDGLAAQRKFDELRGELLIQPVKVGFAAFFEELGRVGLVEEYAPKGFKQVSISGRELREQLRAGNLPDPRIMRKETAEILISRMKAK